MSILCLFTESQNHRFRLKGASPEHPVQVPRSSRVSYSRSLRTMSNWVSSISTDGELHNLSGQDSQRWVFCSCLHPASQLPPQHPQEPQAVDSTPSLMPCQVSSPHPHQVLLWKPRTPSSWGRGVSGWHQWCRATGVAEHSVSMSLIPMEAPAPGMSAVWRASVIYMQKC